jgi:RND family efflux transporter MFP subunit
MIACAAGAAAMFGTACSRPRAVEAADAPPEATPTVAVARASFHDLSRDTVLTANFEPYQEVDVMSKVAGYVKSIKVDIGDRVRQGQVLATLEIPEMADDLTKAGATVDRNAADVSRARDELRRAESAHDMAHLAYTRLAAVQKSRPGLIAQQEIDDAHSRDLVAEAQVAAAKSALAAAEEQVKVAQADRARVKTLYDYTVVTAPFAGVITKRYADTGSMIQAGTASQTQAKPVVRLSQNTLLRLVLPVPESAVPQVRVGETVEVRVPSLHRSFPGRVARFADKLQLDTRTMPTEVDVPNPQLLLVPGMFAEVDLRLEQRTNALTIPVTAVSRSERESSVFAVTDSVVGQRPVKTGLETATRVEILSGLKDGDFVIVGNRAELKPGQRVHSKLTELAAAKGGD